MRVLMVSKACLAGIYQRKLEEIARSKDVELTVVVPPTWRDVQGTVKLERAHLAGYRLLVDPIAWNGNYHLYYFPRLRQRVREFQPDILHIDEEPYNLATWHAWRLAKRAGIRSLFFSWQNLSRRYPVPFRTMEMAVLRGVDHAIVGSQGAAEVWRRKGYRGPLAVIPQFGVDPQLFSPPERRPPGRSFVVGYAGRLVSEKGVDLLIRAVASLPCPCHLAIAGDGPERAGLTALAREVGVQDRLFFDGQLPSARMPAFLQQLDVLVLPSRSRPNWMEQFGRVLIEAMACGAVAVGSNSGEIPNVIGEAGLVFPEDDVAALASHLEYLMTNPSVRSDLAEKGRLRVLTRYTQKRVAAQTVQVYREVMQ
jgi:glycosyltransferase involved in cell wall biosynthesis